MEGDELCRARYGMSKRALLDVLEGERRRERPHRTVLEASRQGPGPTRAWMDAMKDKGSKHEDT